MEIEEPNYCCPECFEGITGHLEITFDITTAAHELLGRKLEKRINNGQDKRFE